MSRKGHSEEQIVYALRQIEGGKKVSEVCREMGVSPQVTGQMTSHTLPRGPLWKSELIRVYAVLDNHSSCSYRLLMVPSK
jgi:transposase